jgi:hypothetical protein
VQGSSHGLLTSCVQEYQRLLGTQPPRRLNPSRLVDNAVLHNKLVDITASLENLSVILYSRHVPVRDCSSPVHSNLFALHIVMHRVI